MNMTPKEIAVKWTARIGLGFHPDTQGRDYRPRLSAALIREYDRDMGVLMEEAEDPYALCLEAMKEVWQC